MSAAPFNNHRGATYICESKDAEGNLVKTEKTPRMERFLQAVSNQRSGCNRKDHESHESTRMRRWRRKTNPSANS